MIKKYGTAHWSGDLKTGTGQVSTETRALSDQPYSFAKRFEGETGSNPEELIGAAHAACFAMALSGELGRGGLTADSIDARSTVSLEPVEGGFGITKIHLTVTARIPGADKQAFLEAANAAKAGCPVSKLMAAAEITMDAALES
ncbi:OsmC family protein [Nioella nitratireducens]|uniref:OsmC family protein n=1 Tax=Nioella nitratireducens TaxID=1287720 RepID=UPI0008FD1B0D|nr:OsmC family protein [Nioella nitratireducens]